MKTKWLIILALMLIVAVPVAFALMDDNSTNLTNTGTNTGTNTSTNTNTASGGAGGSSNASNSIGNVSGLGNKSFSPSSESNVNNDIRSNNENKNVADSNSRSSSNQKQQQGQKQGQAQANIQKGNDVNVSGDKVEGSFAVAYPSQSSQKGQAASTVYSLFGGFSNAQTEEYLKCLEILTAIKALESYGYLNHDEATAEAKEYLAQLKDVAKERRLLGILWKTNSNHLLNGMGLLSWDPCGINIDSIGHALTSPLGSKKKESADVTTVRTDNYSAK